MAETVLITGASRGIGKACAIKFASMGYNVIMGCTRESEHALEAIEEIKSISQNSILLPYDVTDAKQTEQAISVALEKYGCIDSLVLSAGVAYQQLFQYTDEKAYDHVMNVNVKGAYLTAKHLLPSMIHNKGGSIVFISSMWGQVGASLEVIYSASKAAVIGMTKALAKEVGPSGIRVNCVSPGVILTDMTAGFDKDTLDALAGDTPLGRNGLPADVAEAVYFLSSDNAGFITGHDMSVNGGLVI